MSKLTAYDYDKQQWVTGSGAKELLVKQITQDLAVLKSDRAKAFMDWTCRPGTVQSNIEQLEARLSGLAQYN